MIKVTEKYYISSDSYQYILNKKMINQKTNEEYFSQISYHATVDGCVEKVMKILQREKAQEDMLISDFLKECNKINEDMSNILKSIKSCEILK